MKSNTILIILVLSFFLSSYAQTDQKPTLLPFELDGSGQVKMPEPVPEGNWSYSTYENIELIDLKDIAPYRIAANFEKDKLYTLHVLFGETEEGLSIEKYEEIKNILIKLWEEFPTGSIKHRRGLGNLCQIWETEKYRMEWIYKNKPDSTKKMGWLFIYTRNKFSKDY